MVILGRSSSTLCDVGVLLLQVLREQHQRYFCHSSAVYWSPSYTIQLLK